MYKLSILKLEKKGSNFFWKTCNGNKNSNERFVHNIIYCLDNNSNNLIIAVN